MTPSTLDLTHLKALRAQASKEPLSRASVAYVLALLADAEALIAAAEERDGLRAEVATLRAELGKATRRAMNAQGQIDYICDEVGRAAGVPCDAPADVVFQARALKEMADGVHAEVARLRRAAETRMREDGA